MRKQLFGCRFGLHISQSESHFENVWEETVNVKLVTTYLEWKNSYTHIHNEHNALFAKLNLCCKQVSHDGM